VLFMDRNICYISADNFLDTDSPVIKHINNYCNLSWFVVFAKTFSGYSEQSVREYADKYNIKTTTVKLSYRFRDPRIILKYVSLLRRVKETKPDVIYINMLGIPYFFFIVYFLLDRNQVVYAIHDVVNHIKMENKKYLTLYHKFVFSLFKNFHLYSNTQKIIFDDKYPKKHTFYAPFYLKDYGPSLAVPSKNIVNFLFFGTIRENKGLKLLIRVGNKLAKNHHGKFIITIAGNCRNWSEYESLIQDQSIFKKIIKVVPNEDIPRLFGQAHYLILPYLDVTQSGPLLIAYNYKVPAIASDHPGFKEYIHHEFNGYIFESGHEESLFVILNNILTSSNKEYNFIKSNLVKYINDNISLENIIGKYQDMFNKIS
jgi:glycosyltransferase involved in cell wall biosynthesis